MRQTHVIIAVPEIWGHIAVGRTKEGFSMNKVMIGYGGWTMERQPINDATIPILADGVKWLGYVPKAKILWNLGFYGDALSEGQTFSSYENQISGRFAWVPILSTDGGNLLHIGVSERYGKTKDGKIRLKARPGAWAAPFFMDTTEFDASHSTMTSIETYWRPHSVTVGGEYFFESVDAPASGDPIFHGGEAFVTWLITGETRTVQLTRWLLQSGLPFPHGLLWRPRRLGDRRAQHVRGLRRQGDHGRQVLAPDTHAQLVSLGSGEARGRLRLQLAQSIRNSRQDAILPDAHSVAVVNRTAGLKASTTTVVRDRSSSDGRSVPTFRAALSTTVVVPTFRSASKL